MRFAGPCSAKPITIEIQGNILGSTDMSLYKGDRWITIEDVEGINLIGGGTLNGQGETLWHYKKPGGSSEPGHLMPDVCTPLPFYIIHIFYVERMLKWLRLMSYKVRLKSTHEIYNFSIQQKIYISSLLLRYNPLTTMTFLYLSLFFTYNNQNSQIKETNCNVPFF